MRFTFLLLLSLIIIRSDAQKYYSVDLSKNHLNDNTISLEYTGIKLTNTLPKGDYKIKVRVEEERPSPAELKNAPLVKSACMTKFTEFDAAFTALKDASAESDVPRFIADLKAKNEAVPKGDPCKAELESAYKSLVAETEEYFDFAFDVNKNQNINITIARIDDKGAETRTWDFTLRTPRTVSYISHFGFTFSPNIISEFDTYHAKAGTNGDYMITKYKKEDQFWKDLSLTANFIIPFKNNRSDLHVAWMSGVGVGGDTRFTVFTGPTILVSDFTSLGLGFGVNYNHKLKGIYEENQVIREALTFDQLHERGVRPTVLLSLSFRLSKKQLQDTEIETIQ